MWLCSLSGWVGITCYVSKECGRLSEHETHPNMTAVFRRGVRMRSGGWARMD